MVVHRHTKTDTEKQISYTVPLAEFDRSDRNWAEFFIRGALWVSTKSKDRSTKVGAMAVNWDSKAVLGFGYNGFPRGVNDDLDERHARPAKYGYTEHAERNLCYNSARHGIALEGS